MGAYLALRGTIRKRALPSSVTTWLSRSALSRDALKTPCGTLPVTAPPLCMRRVFEVDRRVAGVEFDSRPSRTKRSGPSIITCWLSMS